MTAADIYPAAEQLLLSRFAPDGSWTGFGFSAPAIQAEAEDILHRWDAEGMAAAVAAEFERRHGDKIARAVEILAARRAAEAAQQAAEFAAWLAQFPDGPVRDGARQLARRLGSLGRYEHRDGAWWPVIHGGKYTIIMDDGTIQDRAYETRDTGSGYGMNADD